MWPRNKAFQINQTDSKCSLFTTATSHLLTHLLQLQKSGTGVDGRFSNITIHVKRNSTYKTGWNAFIFVPFPDFRAHFGYQSDVVNYFWFPYIQKWWMMPRNLIFLISIHAIPLGSNLNKWKTGLVSFPSYIFGDIFSEFSQKFKNNRNILFSFATWNQSCKITCPLEKRKLLEIVSRFTFLTRIFASDVNTVYNIPARLWNIIMKLYTKYIFLFPVYIDIPYRDHETKYLQLSWPNWNVQTHI